MRIILLVIALAVLGGCASNQPGSLTGVVTGSTNLRTPEYAVRGQTAYDQRWINVTTEALVDGFGQPRPKPRPPEFDAPRTKAKAAPVRGGREVTQPAKKKRWWQRWRRQSV